MEVEIGGEWMSKGREAIDTITGYYYQFDYYIQQLLSLDVDTDTVCIEGIEDVDINCLNETTAVQCKYYAKTEYNHSVIAKPIRFMLNHYKKNLDNKKCLKYKIYGKFISGQDKLPNNIDITFAKKNFFTYTQKHIKHEIHIELGLNDNEIAKFLECLSIDVNAISYEEQEKHVLTQLREIFSCSEFEAEYYYYNNSLRIVKEIATNQQAAHRVISKRDFLSKINNRNSIFDIWYLQFKGVREYCKAVKLQYFSLRNISPYERFFLIDCDKKISETEIKTLVLKISENWSKISKREVKTICPFVYLHNVSDITKLNIKRSLQNDDFYFCDGYDFKGADFSAKSISRNANAYNGIKIKIINEISQIDEVLDTVAGTREIYQFFIQEPYYENEIHKHIFIKVEETQNISAII